MGLPPSEIIVGQTPQACLSDCQHPGHDHGRKSCNFLLPEMQVVDGCSSEGSRPRLMPHGFATNASGFKEPAATTERGSRAILILMMMTVVTVVMDRVA